MATMETQSLFVFDSQYTYLKTPKGAESGSNPLAHYLVHGARERRNPHPLFDTQYYLEHYGHLLAEDTNPLADFIDHGNHGNAIPVCFRFPIYLSENPKGG
ncbi:MAG: hypothetical protein Ct9H300mP16_08920 [Pseudomonadota bacterium]|nr:MAG: hypothetical protein Ct9H300mP16_08920 [Pseudomonadota bacterium]